MIEKHILNKGVNIVGRFNCYGQFLAVKKGHPNSEDLEKARMFARSMIVQEYPQIAEMEPLAAAAVAASQVARLVSK